MIIKACGGLRKVARCAYRRNPQAFHVAHGLGECAYFAYGVIEHGAIGATICVVMGAATFFGLLVAE